MNKMVYVVDRGIEDYNWAVAVFDDRSLAEEFCQANNEFYGDDLAYGHAQITEFPLNRKFLPTEYVR